MNKEEYSPYISFNRKQWTTLRETNDIELSDIDLDSLQGINENLTLKEIEDIYIPLSQLIRLHYLQYKELSKEMNHFLKLTAKKSPFIIGMAGSVAVGKSTTARILQYLLSQWGDRPQVELVTTDGFLYPNKKLKALGLMEKKGFPESYDVAKLIRFLSVLKSGNGQVSAPVYSHLSYDILPDQKQSICRPDVVILEGVNVLQAPKHKEVGVFISDFFNFSLYIDADEALIEKWYIDRFKILRKTAFQNPKSYFQRFSKLSEEEALLIADRIWHETNKANLYENILPTRDRADLILEKGKGHLVENISIRK
ncbi:type I pantothenate kinase [Lederbergia sp. NSJ-179]|uniref:type I pantothenate kinase n=1 Tax=Lederbergia sp. NSJ-179 TaxID=2931402 RepID=UPI001FD61FD2|nr:type I pantothenate kinase [Lederbergia sp. NSJ-179]MCJ7842510.1 type I pantothenate kinase [Lederbergia sp. NSJ-179]